jgi:hypothetical protein
MKDVTKLCAICDLEFERCGRKKHLQKEHNLTFEQYVLKYIFNDIRPLCKCGCGKETKYVGKRCMGFYRQYIGSHKTQVKQSEETVFKRKNSYLKTMNERYGVNSPTQLLDYVQKRKKTSLERYGCEHPMQNEVLKNKAKATNLERYGVENVLSSKILREKVKNTMNERYGVDYAAQNVEIYKKVKKTNLERYGCEFTFESSQIKNKAKATNLERYGVENILLSKTFRDKIKNTNLERYGNENFLFSESGQKVRKDTMMRKYGVESMFQINGFRQLFNQKHSKKEIEVCEKIGGQLGFMFKKKEYDIKLGNNLFEIDGDYWHTSNLLYMNLPQLNSVVNDFNKIKNVEGTQYNLYKIFISNLPKEITEENLIKNSYVPNFELNYEDVVMTKEYLKKYLNNNKIENVIKYSRVFIKFIKLFLPFIYNSYDLTLLDIAVKNIMGINNGDYILDFSIKNITQELEKIKI